MPRTAATTAKKTPTTRRKRTTMRKPRAKKVVLTSGPAATDNAAIPDELDDSTPDETDGTQEAPESDEPVTVGATRAPEPKKESATDRILDAIGLGKKKVVTPITKAATKAATRKRSSKDVSADFVASLVPILSLGIAVWVRMRITNPEYKHCAPETDELAKVLTPLTRILARRIEIAGKMSEDTIDLSIAVAMTGVMASRIYADTIAVKDGTHDRREQQAREYRAGLEREAREYESVTQSSWQTIANGSGTNHSGTHENGHGNHNGHSYPAGRTGSGAGANLNGGGNPAVPTDGYAILDGQQADDVISRALGTDAQYRASMGLL